MVTERGVFRKLGLDAMPTAGVCTCMHAPPSFPREADKNAIHAYSITGHLLRCGGGDVMNDAADDEGGATVDATALYLAQLNQRIRRGCTAHADPAGRIYYMKCALASLSPSPTAGLPQRPQLPQRFRVFAGTSQRAFTDLKAVAVKAKRARAPAQRPCLDSEETMTAKSCQML
ncbi:hypothetical protein HPB51_010748 [Rhipicephalus microplus]|uniref:Uncharacterized protein n=1 Tax=Rhipicephalus microplus TaxID=6941 RepID=A0A9J6DVD2_RHIMP|nr:hypothetical protein HPB51_010748 [Rhipicephalus microplus]